MTTDNTQGAAEPSPASLGSVQPVLYAVMQAESVLEYCRDKKEAAASADDFNAAVVPLYRSPTLTDAEREAITFMLRHAAYAADIPAFPDSGDYRLHHDVLFSRLK